jgi:hypothetical protein
VEVLEKHIAANAVCMIMGHKHSACYLAQRPVHIAALSRLVRLAQLATQYHHAPCIQPWELGRNQDVRLLTSFGRVAVNKRYGGMFAFHICVGKLMLPPFEHICPGLAGIVSTYHIPAHMFSPDGRLLAMQHDSELPQYIYLLRDLVSRTVNIGILCLYYEAAAMVGPGAVGRFHSQHGVFMVGSCSGGW